MSAIHRNPGYYARWEGFLACAIGFAVIAIPFSLAALNELAVASAFSEAASSGGQAHTVRVVEAGCDGTCTATIEYPKPGFRTWIEVPAKDAKPGTDVAVVILDSPPCELFVLGACIEGQTEFPYLLDNPQAVRSRDLAVEGAGLGNLLIGAIALWLASFACGVLTVVQRRIQT